MKEIFNEVIKGIKYGIEIDNNASRPFEILDYYEITNITPEKLYQNIKRSITKDELTAFKNFIKTNKTSIESDNFYFRQLFNIKEEYNTLRDENGVPIPGTGRTIANEEKQMIKDYLHYLNVPLTYNTYTCAINRYIKDEIRLIKKMY